MGCWQEKLAGARSAIPKDLDFIPGQWGTVEVSLGEKDGVRCVFWEACPSLYSSESSSDVEPNISCHLADETQEIESL